MRSYTITLFSRPPQRERAPSAFVVSIVLHSCLFALLLLSVKHVSVVQPRLPNRKYTVRLLDVRQAVASLHYIPRQPALHRGAAARRSISAGGKLGNAHVSQMRIPHISRNFESLKPAPQTLIQPEVPPEQRTLAEIPVPRAVVWTPGKIVLRRITTPAPKPPGAIQVKPSLKMPNHELNPAEVSLSSTPFQTIAPIPAPGTTSPVAMSGVQPAQQIPETASKNTAEISPARVISMSDVKMADGTAALPVINEVAPSDETGSPNSGATVMISEGGEDTTNSKASGTGAGNGANSGGNNSGGFTVADGSNPNPGPDDGVTIDTGGGTDAVLTAEAMTPKHIVLPKTGQYGMVIVGASPEQNYPETANLWTGRVVYTVYLQSETPQSWILQYSLPKPPGDDPDDRRPEAPWPYDMMRPSLGSYKDIVLVHGFVNKDGRFEKLSVAYPPSFVEASLLMRALKQWQFRPAMIQGQPVSVEILLIIPGASQ